MACFPGYPLTIPGLLWDVGLKPYHMLWGQKSLRLPLLLSQSGQAGEWSFAQMLYTQIEQVPES